MSRTIKKRRHSSPIEIVRRIHGRGTARNFIHGFSVKPGQKFLLCLRVSTRSQNHHKNLDNQERFLRFEVESRGGVVVGVIRFVESGFDSSWLHDAPRLSQIYGATLLATTTDRFVRHLWFHSKEDWNAQATNEGLRDLQNWTHNLPLMTFLDPDAPPSEVKSFQSKLGQQTKCCKGGRPKKQPAGYKRSRREELLPRVLQLHREGKSLRVISSATNVPVMTLHDWIQLYG